MKMVAYVRVSTIGQAKDGLGVPTQERMIRAWLKSGRHRLLRIVQENGKSGTLDETERPGLLEALKAVQTREAEALIVTSLDRLARALTVQEAVVAKVWAYGGRLFTVDGGEVLRDDPDDPMRTAMRQMAGVFAELDRRMIVKRLRNGRLTKAARGGYAVGRPAYGWRAERGALVAIKDEQAVIERIRRWHRNEVSLAEIARRLNDQQIAPRAGKRWYPTTVARVIHRE